jgi:transcriptional regulator with XRE-family HTH domain
MPKRTKPSEDVRATIGRNVSRLRKEAGLKQNDVAEKCGMFRTYLSRIENGTANPTAIALVSLASAFGVTVGDLFEE